MTKEFDLNEKQVDEIKSLNSRLVSVKNLLLELKDNDFLYNKLITDLAETQQKYDDWFAKLEDELKVVTTSTNSWNVDFVNKKLQLI